MWEFFKIFAGPIATTLASTVAVIVTGYFAYHQKRIASEQRQIAGTKLRLDLFDRRYELYESIFPYYNALMEWHGSSEQQEAKTRFFLAYHQSRFLFGRDVQAIFNELVQAGQKVISFKEKEESFRTDPVYYHKSFEETQTILINLFDDRLRKLQSAISTAIDFSKI